MMRTTWQPLHPLGFLLCVLSCLHILADGSEVAIQVHDHHAITTNPIESNVNLSDSVEDVMRKKESVENNNVFNISRCTSEHLGKIRGWLLDLDGTMYSPSGLLPGASKFFDWTERGNVSYVLLSNGFKTKEGVAAKFASKNFLIRQKIDPEDVYTAGIAIAKFLENFAPRNSKIFAVGTSIMYGDGSKDSLPRILQRNVEKDLFDTWDIRTDLSFAEALQWAHLAKDLNKPVFVVQAFMGSPKDAFGDDPVTGKPGYMTLDYELLKKMNIILRNNGYYVVGAPDVADAQLRNSTYPNVDTSWPTMGGTEALLLTSAELFPGSDRERKFHFNTGKGGNHGAEYMMIPAIEKLRNKIPDLRPDEIMIVGDNFGTDIAAGGAAGIESLLVLTGAHQLSDSPNWPYKPSCYLENVGQITDIVKND